MAPSDKWWQAPDDDDDGNGDGLSISQPHMATLDMCDVAIQSDPMLLASTAISIELSIFESVHY